MTKIKAQKIKKIKKRRKKKKSSFFKIVVLSSIVVAIYLIHLFLTVPTGIIPYPYVVKPPNLTKEEIQGIKSAHILIIGDQMGKYLDLFIPELNEKLSKNLRKPLKIYNISKKNYGLHRSLAVLKRFKKLPPVIIFHGASQEFYEKKFNLKDRKLIKKNLNKFQNETLVSLIMTLPFLSKILYHRPNIIRLGNKMANDQTEYSEDKKMLRLELIYRLFELEIYELIQLAKDKNSTLILTTTPVNLDLPPQDVCEATYTKNIHFIHNEISKMIKGGDYKTAYERLKELEKVTMANARTYFYLGTVTSKLARYNEAREYLGKASAFDCATWRVNIVYNAIIRRNVLKYNSFIVDFDQMVNDNYGQDVLFIDKVFPQHTYYRKMIGKLRTIISKILKL